jgi:preprotein translocase subunit SecD
MHASGDRACEDGPMRAAMIAAAVAVILGTAACTSSTPSLPVSSHPAAPTIRVSCSSIDGSPVAGDVPTVRERATELGARVVDLRSASTTVQIDVRGVSVAQARGVCTTPVVEVRGLVAAPVTVRCAPGKCSADSVSTALRTAHLDPAPLTEASYTVLSAADRRAVGAALARFDCSSVRGEKDDLRSYFVSCADHSAYYLGPAIVSGSAVADAVADPPGQGNPGWTVVLSFTRTGSARLAAYTGAHNFAGTAPSVPVSRCSYATAPCANWVAFTIDGTIASVPYNLEAINGGTMEISGSFTATSAKQLAGQLSTALPVALRVDSIQTLR